MIKRIIKSFYRLYYTSSSKRFLAYLRKQGIKVGDGTIIWDPKHIQIDTTRPELLEIGENVFLHKGTIILTHDWASWCFINSDAEFYPSHERIKIGSNVWLGENVTILKGVTIGNNVIIGIGTIVTKDIPSNSIVAGIPAKVVGTYDDYLAKRSMAYVNEAIDYAKAILESGREPQVEDFYDDYPCFVDGRNYQDYDYPYSRVFSKAQFEIWKNNHRAPFNGFHEFIKAVRLK